MTLTNPRVLILEDDLHSRRLAQLSVEMALPNADIVMMGSVQEATTYTRPDEERFSLCLLDAMLGDGTVEEAWPHLRPLCTDNPLIIMVSALHHEALAPLIRDIPVKAVLQKPYSPQTLMTLLDSES